MAIFNSYVSLPEGIYIYWRYSHHLFFHFSHPSAEEIAQNRSKPEVIKRPLVAVVGRPNVARSAASAVMASSPIKCGGVRQQKWVISVKNHRKTGGFHWQKRQNYGTHWDLSDLSCKNDGSSLATWKWWRFQQPNDATIWDLSNSNGQKTKKNLDSARIAPYFTTKHVGKSLLLTFQHLPSCCHHLRNGVIPGSNRFIQPTWGSLKGTPNSSIQWGSSIYGNFHMGILS